MRSVVFVLLMCIAPLVRADAPPPCYPGEDAADSMLPTFVADDKENCAAVWFCDVGHKWNKVAIYGHGDNVDNCAYGYAKAVIALFATHAQKDALWNERFVAGIEQAPAKQAQYQAQDAPARVLAMAVPFPTKAPPSGLVTQTTKAYKRSESINGYSIKAIGTVTLGTECNEGNVITDSTGKRYHALDDRNKVAMTKANNLTPVRPTTAYGSCEP